ncbi:MAG: hypothetical protein IJH78_06230 [Clostridia bacterium]|nr:hypothetical protein [Clostridia bacterium]
MDETERTKQQSIQTAAQAKEKQWEERLVRKPEIDIDQWSWMQEARLI